MSGCLPPGGGLLIPPPWDCPQRCPPTRWQGQRSSSWVEGWHGDPAAGSDEDPRPATGCRADERTGRAASGPGCRITPPQAARFGFCHVWSTRYAYPDAACEGGETAGQASLLGDSHRPLCTCRRGKVPTPRPDLRPAAGKPRFTRQATGRRCNGGARHGSSTEHRCDEGDQVACRGWATFAEGGTLDGRPGCSAVGCGINRWAHPR